MPIDLALDVSQRRSGAAWDGPPGGVPRSTCYAAPKGISGEDGKGIDYGPMGAGYERWLLDLIALVQPNRITYEAPMQVIREMKDGERLKTTQATVRALFGLGFLTETIAYRLRIPCYEQHAGSARKDFMGNGHADKRAIFARCQQLGWRPKNTDESDALCLWASVKVTSDRTFRLPLVLAPGDSADRMRIGRRP